MLSMDQILEQAKEFGFTNAGPLKPDTMKFMPEVRDMCASDRCGMYGRSWTCPPGCGSLDALKNKAAAYAQGVLLQTTGKLEDDFDIETMQETERVHKEHFSAFAAWLRSVAPDCMPMASGACQLCAKCTYPTEPCRLPALAIPSMEACGLLVSRICEQAGLPYYYGPRTMTYSSCALFNK